MISRREEHARLRRVDADVVEDGLELRRTKSGGTSSTAVDADRVLRGQRDDRRHAEAARGGERLQVGLDPGAAARVGARRSSDSAVSTCAPFAGMNRIRFNGCVLSLGARHPGGQRYHRLVAVGVARGTISRRRGARAPRLEPPREARTAPFPDELHPKLRAALEARGVARAVRAPARGLGRRRARRARRDHDRHGEREVARLQPPGARRARARAEAARALPLPDEGAGAGPAALARAS